MYFFKTIFVMAVLLKSLSAEEVYETVDAVVGHDAKLPCNVTAEKAGDDLKVLAWYRNGSSTAFYSSDQRKDSVAYQSPDGYSLVTDEDDEGIQNLVIRKVRPSDAGLYHCFADFASSPSIKTFVMLNVIVPPQRMWVVFENGSHVATTSAGTNNSKDIGPFYVGDRIRLFCVVFKGSPRPSISWWDEQRQLKDTSTPLSSHRVRSDLDYGPLSREDHGKVLTCHSSNNDEAPALAISIVIDMYLPPELVAVQLSDGEPVVRATAGESLTFECRVLGARPQPTAVTWRLGNAVIKNIPQNITSELTQRRLVSQIELCMRNEFDESLLTCCVPSYSRVPEEYVCAPGLPLTVLYAPALKIEVQGDMENNTLSIVKGSNVTLTCSHQANPPVYQMIWFHETDIYSAIEGNQANTLQSTIDLTSVTEGDAGEYACSATNDVGTERSEPVFIDVTYPAYCEDEVVSEYGIAEGESVNLTCKVKGNPIPVLYRWVFVNDAVSATALKTDPSHAKIEFDTCTIQYQRPHGATFTTIFCWGLSNVTTATNLPNTPCTFLVTDQTVPRPPAECSAVKSSPMDITVSCEKGHDGGLPQKFKFMVKSEDEELVSITNMDPQFIVQEPKREDYKFLIIAYNEKGESQVVEIKKEEILDKTAESQERPVSAVTNITTLALALCGGVALVALTACGLVLCAHDRGSRASDPPNPPLCAYNTDESNCETCHDSDESEGNLRRTESFRHAISRNPSRNQDVRRSSSFHSTRYLNDMIEQDDKRYNPKHSNKCRVHSLQNISKKRDMDALCDHLVLHLPPETGYNVPKPMNTFYTMPRKIRQKSAREFSDEASEITQVSDGFSLPPPPDEFTSYRAGTKIKDVPKASLYGTIRKAPKEQPNKQYSNVIISPLNTVGLPTISGTHNSLYSYPSDEQHPNAAKGNPFDDS